MLSRREFETWNFSTLLAAHNYQPGARVKTSIEVPIGSAFSTSYVYPKNTETDTVNQRSFCILYTIFLLHKEVKK